MPEDSKTCTKCHETKTLSEFHRDKRSPDGRTTRCAACNRAASHAYRVDHRDQATEYARAYYVANRVSVLAYKGDRYRESPDAARKYRHARVDRLKGAATDVSVSLTAVCERFGYVCHLCGNTIPQNASERRYEPSLDHLVPVSSPDYPNHGTTWDNVRPAHRGCNSARGNKPLDTWFAYLARARSRAPWFTD